MQSTTHAAQTCCDGECLFPMIQTTHSLISHARTQNKTQCFACSDISGIYNIQNLIGRCRFDSSGSIACTQTDRLYYCNASSHAYFRLHFVSGTGDFVYCAICISSENRRQTKKLSFTVQWTPLHALHSGAVHMRNKTHFFAKIGLMSEITHWPGTGARIGRVFRYPLHLQRRLIRSSSKTANAVWISDCALNVQYARGLHSGRLVTRSHTALHLDDVKSFVAVTNTNKQAQQSSRDRRLGISNLVMRSLIRLRRAFIRFLSEIKQKIYSKIRGLCHLSLTGSLSLSHTLHTRSFLQRFDLFVV